MYAVFVHCRHEFVGSAPFVDGGVGEDVKPPLFGGDFFLVTAQLRRIDVGVRINDFHYFTGILLAAFSKMLQMCVVSVGASLKSPSPVTALTTEP